MFNFIRPAFYFKFSPFIFFCLFISLRKRKFLSKLIKHEWVPALKDFISAPGNIFFFSLLLFYNFFLFCFITNFSFKLYLIYYLFLSSILRGIFFCKFLSFFLFFFFLYKKCSSTFLSIVRNILKNEICKIIYARKSKFNV